MSISSSSESKNDLSYDSADIDFQQLLKTAAIAVRYSRDQLSRYVHMSYDIQGKPFSPVYSESLEEAAKHFRIASDMYYVLREAVTRSRIAVVNKPPVNESDKEDKDVYIEDETTRKESEYNESEYKESEYV